MCSLFKMMLPKLVQGASLLLAASLVSCDNASMKNSGEGGNSRSIGIDSVIAFEKQYDLKIPLQKGQSLPPVKVKVNLDDTLITFMDYQRNKIIRWDYDKEKIEDPIDVRLHDHKVYIQNYKILGPNRIILTYNPNFFGGYHNKAIVMIDQEKNIIDSFNFRGAKVNIKGYREWPKYKNYYLDFTYFPIVYNHQNHTVIAPLASYKSPCDSFYMTDTLGLLGTVATLSHDDPGFSKLNFDFPCSKYGSTYWDNAKYLRGGYNTSANKIAIGTGHSNEIQIIDLVENTTQTKQIPWSSDGKPVPSTKKDAPMFDRSNPEYLGIKYDRNRKGYWFLARLGLNDKASALLNNYPLHELIFSNKKFNQFSKGILPFGYSEPYIPFKNGILAYNKKQSTKQGKIIFSYFKLSLNLFHKDMYAKRRKAKLKEINQKHTCSKLEYLKAYSTNKNKFLLVPLENTCSACIKKLTSYINKNKHALKQDIALILIASNPSIVEDFKASAQIKNQEWVHEDVKMQWKQSFDEWTNLKLVGTNNQGEISLEKTYDPLEMVLLFDQLK